MKHKDYKPSHNQDQVRSPFYNYQYSHDFKDAFVDQNYFPDEIPEKQYYKPKEIGRESKLKERLKSMWRRRFKGTE